MNATQRRLRQEKIAKIAANPSRYYMLLRRSKTALRAFHAENMALRDELYKKGNSLGFAQFNLKDANGKIAALLNYRDELLTQISELKIALSNQESELKEEYSDDEEFERQFSPGAK